MDFSNHQIFVKVCVFGGVLFSIDSEEKLVTSKDSRKFIDGSTPWKTKMEPENHPFEKEQHLNLTFLLGFHV